MNTALLSFHSRQESSRIVRTSWSIFKCFLFFDVCLLLSGITLMVMGLKDGLFFEKDDIEEKRLLVMSGVALGMFATVSSMCNRFEIFLVVEECKILSCSLSCHGLRVWRRVYLIPWLSFYLLILGIVATCLLTELYSHNFLLRWNHIFLFFAVFTIFYFWSHVKKQFLLMGLPRPEQVNYYLFG